MAEARLFLVDDQELILEALSDLILICENNEIVNNAIINYKISHQEAVFLPVSLNDAQLIIDQEPDLVVVDSPNVTQEWVDCFLKKKSLFFTYGVRQIIKRFART